MIPESNGNGFDELFKGKLTRIGVIVLSSIILLTWLYHRAEHISVEQHYTYSHQLQLLQETNARVDAEVLAGRLELSRNFDSLSENIANLSRVNHSILDIPDYLNETDTIEVRKMGEALSLTIKDKVDLVDRFKRNNAILRNSLTYFQGQADKVLSGSSQVKRQLLLERYVRQTLFYVRTPSQDNQKKLVELKQLINLSFMDDEETAKWESLLLHGGIIEVYQPVVDRLVRQLLNLKTISQYEQLTHAYLQGYNNARIQARFYRNLLYTVALILTLYLAFIFLNLEKTRVSLTRANHEVTRRYNAQKKAEKDLLLHSIAFHSAHEGISLTDAKGVLQEINPAFSRITGYERAEVIGKNTRILKSGRHDDTFYRNMWGSIRKTGHWRGEIWNRNKFGEIYPQLLSITSVHDAEGAVTNFIAVFSDISRLKEQEQELKKMAHYDSLTQLPNRVLLVDRITQSQYRADRDGNFMALCFIDLDGFKPINDNFGHKTGDRLLVKLANRFRETLRGGDTVARLGGDEFVFIFIGLDNEKSYEVLVDRLLKKVSQPLKVDDIEIKLSASVGVTIYPTDKTDADTLLRHADQAMYQAKKHGKNRYTLFDFEKDTHERSQNERILRIEEALKNDEFMMYYQPKVDLQLGEVYGMEALIRWQHPLHGLLLPMEFLPIIEDIDLIIHVGNWVFDKVFEQMQKWLDDGFNFSVSINVTGKQLQDPELINNLRTRLENHPDIKPENVELEVLETVALEDIVTVSQLIKECNELGVRFSLDDFGTGYSSLIYLKRLPASTLKIDLSFIRDMNKDPENLAIVHGIMGLARAFQKDVIAEGVESTVQSRMLMQLGCTQVQGNGISKPMHPESVLKWVKNWAIADELEYLSNLYWEESDYPILTAEVEHLRWVSGIVSAVKNSLPISQTYIGDHKRSNFGRWYYSMGTARYSQIQPCFQRLGESHVQSHKIGEKIDFHIQQGDIVEAKELIPELIENRDRIVKELSNLSKEVAHERKFKHLS